MDLRYKWVIERIMVCGPTLLGGMFDLRKSTTVRVVRCVLARAPGLCVAAMEELPGQRPLQKIGKYEYTRLMAARVTALARNAPPMVVVPPNARVDALLQTAEREFASGVLPLSIVRRLPSNETETVRAQHLTRVPLCFPEAEAAKPIGDVNGQQNKV